MIAYVKRNQKLAARPNWADTDQQRMTRLLNSLGIESISSMELRGRDNRITLTGTGVTFQFYADGRYRRMMVYTPDAAGVVRAAKCGGVSEKNLRKALKVMARLHPANAGVGKSMIAPSGKTVFVDEVEKAMSKTPFEIRNAEIERAQFARDDKEAALRAARTSRRRR